MHTRYDTNDVAISERFAFWRESVCDSYVQLGCETESHRDFTGLIEVAHHSIVSVSKVSGVAHRVNRRKQDISASTDAYFLLSLQTAESSQVSQFGKTALLKPGDMALYSSVEPYQLKLTDNFSQTVVQLPLDKLLTRLPNAQLLTARCIDGQTAMGKLVRENILAFVEHISSPDEILQTLVQETLIDLIATGLASDSMARLELSSPEQQLVLRARSFIQNHLGDPNLDRHRVATKMGLSVRRLNEIFSKQNESISTVIRNMRLAGVAADLKDIRFAGSSISDIAFRYGFSNLQNFSTVFRANFGRSPREYRKES